MLHATAVNVAVLSRLVFRLLLSLSMLALTRLCVSFFVRRQRIYYENTTHQRKPDPEDRSHHSVH
jgi:hypothetical protein